MNTCDTCKHWEIPFGSGFRGCRAIDSGGAHRLGNGDLDKAATAGVHVDEGYVNVPLITGPKFGCTLHETK